MSKRALVAFVVGTVVGAVVLTGCQSNPKPPPLDSASESPSPSESPTEAAPTLPPEAKGTSEAAAKAFVRHYVASVNHAMSTGDVRALEALGVDGCNSCNAVTANISSLYAAGGHLEGDGWRITAIGVLADGRRTSTVVQAGVFVNSQKRFTAPDSNPERFKGGQQSMTFYLRRVSGTWSVERWSQSS